MSLASLAAYASSDDDEDEMVVERETVLATTADSCSDGEDGGTLPPPQTTSRLPLPLPARAASEVQSGGSVFQADDVVDDVPLASALRPSHGAAATKPKSGTVRIVLPSLSEFEDEELPAKKFKPSNKGSGLFSLLPPPKSSGASLVPLSLSRPTAKPAAVRKPPLPAPTQSLAATSTADEVIVDDDDDDEDDSCKVDFFSLSSHAASVTAAATASCATAAATASITASCATAAATAAAAVDDPHTEEVTFQEQQQQQSLVEPVAQFPEAPLPGPAMPSSVHDMLPEPLPSSSHSLLAAGLDSDALLCLRGRHRRAAAAEDCHMHVIDVNQDDILADREQWMRQSLTESRVKRQPQKSADDPTAQQRRKHQITYLAHQAKDREIELQLEWSQNRATKQAYKNKYGF